MIRWDLECASFTCDVGRDKTGHNLQEMISQKWELVIKRVKTTFYGIQRTGNQGTGFGLRLWRDPHFSIRLIEQIRYQWFRHCEHGTEFSEP
ncbi:hypothetical protein RRG08_055626 [Elysia crispata]|uniref:Uncharacterized protein n=1 Tax=Elysia crispata TaxID=231223 RepID=A0AAE1DBJ7_9GAST|nr:hypothetical protein RRG08_055626 [Elysia crispata]